MLGSVHTQVPGGTAYLQPHDINYTPRLPAYRVVESKSDSGGRPATPRATYDSLFATGADLLPVSFVVQEKVESERDADAVDGRAVVWRTVFLRPSSG